MHESHSEVVMNKSLLIVGIALGIGTTACSSTGHAVRGSTTAHAGNASLVASSPPLSYRDFPVFIDSAQSHRTTSKSSRWDSAGPSYSDFPIDLESRPSRTEASAPAGWYRIAPQHPLMSERTAQQTAMLPR